MTNTPIRFGLIGFGLFGSHHAGAIAQTEGAELTAIAVKSEASQNAAREKHPGAAIYGDYREMLTRSDIDVVDVVVPNQLHYEVARNVLTAGKHLLLEKPMALTLPHCDELVATATAKKLTLAINHELRLSSLWGGVKQLIDDGAIGRPLHALIELSRFPYRAGSENWRYDIERVGNWILEEPIHFFDLARWYLGGTGEPKSIYARANSRHREHPELRDNFSATVNFPNEVYAVISQTLSAFGHHVSAKIAGSEGAICAYWSAADARSDRPSFGLQYGMGDDVQEMTFDKSTGELLELTDQIAAVVRSLQEGTPVPCTAEDGRWSSLLCLAAQHSVDTGGLVSIDEYLTGE